MHYFGIAIVGPNGDLDSLLAPFDETDEQYFIREVGEETCADEYKAETATFHIAPDGQKYFTWNSPHKAYWDDGKRVNPELPDGWREEELPLTEYYPNIGAFLENWKGYSWDSDRQEHFTEYNPHGKFDYFVNGGRAAGLLKATKGERLAEKARMRRYEAEHGEPLYGEHDYDIAELDDLIEGEQEAYYFVVLPGGEWLEKPSWGAPDGLDFGKHTDEEHAKWNQAMWDECIAPYRGLGCTAYAIDIHD